LMISGRPAQVRQRATLVPLIATTASACPISPAASARTARSGDGRTPPRPAATCRTSPA
jgi:hypothetical protein